MKVIKVLMAVMMLIPLAFVLGACNNNGNGPQGLPVAGTYRLSSITVAGVQFTHDDFIVYNDEVIFNPEHATYVPDPDFPNITIHVDHIKINEILLAIWMMDVDERVGIADHLSSDDITFDVEFFFWDPEFSMEQIRTFILDIVAINGLDYIASYTGRVCACQDPEDYDFYLGEGNFCGFCDDGREPNFGLFRNADIYGNFIDYSVWFDGDIEFKWDNISGVLTANPNFFVTLVYERVGD